MVILFATAIVDSHPPSYIAMILLLIQNDSIVCLPREASRSVSYFTVSSDSLGAVDFPVEGWQSIKSFG